jgi:hypothetical protein
MVGLRVRIAAAEDGQILALCWDCQAYLWGRSAYEQLGHEDKLGRR